MVSLRLFLYAACFGPASVVDAYIWPNEKTDYLEGMIYEPDGNGPSSPIQDLVPCPGPSFGTGRSTVAEWLRTAFHDMANADAEAGSGGIDASIGFEVYRDENRGKGFNETLNSLRVFITPRSSLADMIALGAVQAVGLCSNGSVNIPFRGGRIDASGPGPIGVPTPEQDLDTHIKMFARQGFNKTEMIALVACGHTFGGVHGVDFPEIVDVVNDPTVDDNTQSFDNTDQFDNVMQFLAKVPQNPLAFGHNVTTRSDARIFGADDGVLIQKMAKSSDFFFATCKTLLERMVNTVPREVQLTEPIKLIPAKPDNLFTEIHPNGIMEVTGKIRLTEKSTVIDPNRVVRIYFRPRSGKTCLQNQGDQDCIIVNATPDAGDWTGPYYGNTPPFRRYSFSVNISTSKGYSGYDVEVLDKDKRTVFDNNGGGFHFDDSVLIQRNLGCVTGPSGPNFSINITVAVSTSRIAHIKVMKRQGLRRTGSR
ncbi:heme peroxidase [Thozetella sp. PMI_491]|nr:heme peroxidase [Thozetella sp. PMI_491]